MGKTLWKPSGQTVDNPRSGLGGSAFDLHLFAAMAGDLEFAQTAHLVLGAALSADQIDVQIFDILDLMPGFDWLAVSVIVERAHRGYPDLPDGEGGQGGPQHDHGTRHAATVAPGNGLSDGLEAFDVLQQEVQDHPLLADIFVHIVRAVAGAEEVDLMRRIPPR